MSTTAPPRFRRDLTIVPRQAAGERFFVVKDPASGRFFRFREAEHFIAEQLDGATPVDVVRRRAEAAFGASLPDATLRAFLANLTKAGLLEGTSSSPRDGAGRRRWLRGTLLYLRFPLFDPDRVFAWIAPRVRFCFTPGFAALSIGLVVLATALTIGNAADMTRDLRDAVRVASLLPVLFVILLVGAAHESAHGVTCKHFGGAVHELGFMLIYFNPAFYCNVNDAWLFPERSKRLLVGLAGLYVELVVWALAVLTWRTTDAGTWVHATALFVTAVAGLRSFLDLNPLIKLDGYYVLSDYLEIPNLRRRAFRYVGDLIKRLVGTGEGPDGTLSPRERRLLLAYGLIGTISSFALLAYGIVKVGGYLLASHRQAGFLAFAGYAGLKSQRRVRRLFGRPSGSGDPDEGDPDDAPGDSGPAPSPDPGQRTKGRTWRRVAWPALAVVVLAWLALGHMELRVGGPVVILPEENTDVRAAVEGIIAQALVDEGQQVRPGDVIARLSDVDLEAELKKSEARVRELQADLAKLEAGPTPQDIALARTALAKAQDDVRFTQSKLARDKTLFDRNMISAQELEDSQAAAAAAAHAVADAQGRLDLLLRGARPEDIAAARAQLEGERAEQRYLTRQLGLVDIVSPVAGTVATPSRDLHELVGRHVTRGDLIAKVFEVRTVAAQVTVGEKDVADVHPGQPVVLRSRAWPNITFSGAVAAISTAADGFVSPGDAQAAEGTPAPSSANAVRSFVVTTHVDNSAGRLRAGMTGFAKISCGRRRVTSLLMRSLAHTLRVEFWSWW